MPWDWSHCDRCGAAYPRGGNCANCKTLEPREAQIVINGVQLTSGQAMAIRVAVETFATDLQNGLGDDELGHAYLAHVSAIRRALYRR